MKVLSHGCSRGQIPHHSVHEEGRRLGRADQAPNFGVRISSGSPRSSGPPRSVTFISPTNRPIFSLESFIVPKQRESTASAGGPITATTSLRSAACAFARSADAAIPTAREHAELSAKALNTSSLLLFGIAKCGDTFTWTKNQRSVTG